MNKVELLGRLTKDPVVSMGGSGVSIARITIACDRRFKSEGQPTADFIGCVAFGKTAEFLEKYFKKGMKIAVCGRIQTGSYTNNDGNTVYTTDVIIEDTEFVESKSSSDQKEPEASKDGFMDIPEGTEEEMPFA